MSGGYGPPGRGSRRPADDEPAWDSSQAPGQAGDWPRDQDTQIYGAPGYGDQARNGGRYAGPGYRDPDYRDPSGRPAPARYDGGDYPPPRDDSFVPGFGRGQEPARGDRGGRYPDQSGYDQSGYDQGGDGRRGPEPRWPGGPDQGARQDGWGPGNWGADGGGPDPRGRDDLRRDDWAGPDDRPRRKKATRWLPRILVLVVVFGILGGLLVGGLYVRGKYEAKYHPADYAGAGTDPAVTVQVLSGETPSLLAPTLVKLGIVASDRAFTNAAEASTSTATIEPGFFTLRHHMQASLAYAALLNPANRVQLGVTIPEGKRASQVILILAKETKIPLKNFQQVIDHPAKLGLPSYAKGRVEGYLFPATYAIEPHETALAILQAMVARFNVEAAQVGLATAAKAVGLTPTQVIIEASMAQAEGGSVSDYPKIARVIINRLKDGMHLQFDSVLLYGLHAYAINVTDKQIATKGPYNDFEHAGLPPGPISNPGDAAIQGILHPASGDWLYFLTNSGGKSTFSATPLTGQ